MKRMQVCNSKQDFSVFVGHGSFFDGGKERLKKQSEKRKRHLLHTVIKVQNVGLESEFHRNMLGPLNTHTSTYCNTRAHSEMDIL